MHTYSNKIPHYTHKYRHLAVYTIIQLIVVVFVTVLVLLELVLVYKSLHQFTSDLFA